MNGTDAVLFVRWILCLPFRILNNFVRLREHISFLRLATAAQGSQTIYGLSFLVSRISSP